MPLEEARTHFQHITWGGPHHRCVAQPAAAAAVLRFVGLLQLSFSVAWCFASLMFPPPAHSGPTWDRTGRRPHIEIAPVCCACRAITLEEPAASSNAVQVDFS